MPGSKLMLAIQRKINYILTVTVVILAYDFQLDQEIPHISKHNPSTPIPQQEMWHSSVPSTHLCLNTLTFFIGKSIRKYHIEL